ncbi:MAG: archease, partial [Candidatus Latescibacterota bacterium]
MAYRYLEDIATADSAFEATGRTREELIIAAADALMNVMVENLDSIEQQRIVDIGLEADTFEMLLFRLLDDLVYYKDAERLLLRIRKVELCTRGES